MGEEGVAEDSKDPGRGLPPRFSQASQLWFSRAFAGPTRAQLEAWESISSGENTLVIAPTGSGKTLAAFLWSIDQLAHEKTGGEQGQGVDPDPAFREPGNAQGDSAPEGVSILYISPLKALGVDVERNLRAPLEGIAAVAAELGLGDADLTAGVRSGDTPASERRRLVQHPPDILITTPESLYLMLTSEAARTLASVRAVIVDEVHALVGTKRGAHLALSLERLEMITPRSFQRIGLSATVEPPKEVARFLGGDRPVRIVQPPNHKKFEITVEVPVPDMTNVPRPSLSADAGISRAEEHRLGSMWPSIEASVYKRIMSARSTIVFANARRTAERLTANINRLHEEQMVDEGTASAGQDSGPVAADLAPPPDPLVMAHHGSISKEARKDVEEGLKQGRLRCVVATSSLELGIDMGAVDQVIQIDPPPSVASGLQRLGRSGHGVGQVSRAIFYPAHRSKLVETAAIVSGMKEGRLEPLHVVSNPLDILAQQTIAAASVETLDIERWLRVVRRAAPFTSLPRSAYVATLDLISGKYPSSEFANLRARVDWDRGEGTLKARPGAKRLAVTGGGTIPDRGLYRVVTGVEGGPSSRVGELDEEMVYETRVGDVFALGTTSWRVTGIGRDQVQVVPAFGVPGNMPFWHGDSPSRPARLGGEIAELGQRLQDDLQDGKRDRAEQLLTGLGFDRYAVANTLALVQEQVEVCGSMPTPGLLIVEQTKDEVGDWRIVLESPYGSAVHGPWALAVNHRIQQQLGIDGQAIASNDGMIVRVSDTSDSPPGAELFAFEPDQIAALVTDQVQGSALFSARFRECSQRALTLGSGKPGTRSPLWQQRQRSSRLLEVAARYPDFPLILETFRECLQDVYDIEALQGLMVAIQTRKVRLGQVRTENPGPYARSLLFSYVGEFMYEGDTPLAERKIAALSVGPQVLQELLGEVDFRELLQSEAILQVEQELQHLRDGWRVSGESGVVDLLRALGPLTQDEIIARTVPRGLADRSTTPAEEEGTEAETARTQQPVQETTALVRQVIAGRKAFATGDGDRQFVVALEDAGVVAALDWPVPDWVPQEFLAVQDLRPAAGPRVDHAVSPVDKSGFRMDDAVSRAGEADARADRERVAASVKPSWEWAVHDLAVRYAQTHGPFLSTAFSDRYGLDPEDAERVLRALTADGRLARGHFWPDDLYAELGLEPGPQQYVDQRVLARIKAVSLAVLRGSVEPVEGPAYAQMLLERQHVPHGVRDADGVFEVVDQLAGLPLPASALESLILPVRVKHYGPALLDELMTSGEVVWVGHSSLSGTDGWVSLHLADTAALTMRGLARQGPDRVALGEETELERAIVETLRGKGALFVSGLLPELADRGMTPSATALAEAMWALVWSSRITSDSMAALRAKVQGRAGAQKTRPRSPRLRSRRSLGFAAAPGASGVLASGAASMPELQGRWSLLPDPVRNAGDLTEAQVTTWLTLMLERYGVVTPGTVRAEGLPGGFAQAYQLYKQFEQVGACRRGYYVKGQGGAQFASSSTIDVLRDLERAPHPTLARPIALAAVDPANAYGVTVPWPEPVGGHEPRRNPGALVVLMAGEPVLYLERGGKSAVTFQVADGSDDQKVAVAAALVDACRRGNLESFTLESINGGPVYGSSWESALVQAGLAPVPQGLRLRREWS